MIRAAAAVVVGLAATLVPLTTVRAESGCEPGSTDPTCVQNEEMPTVPSLPRSVWLHELDPAALPAVQSRLDEVLDHVVDATRAVMMDFDVQVHVVPEDKRLTDLPPWTHLRGVLVPDGRGDPYPEVRTYDQVRGLGPATCADGPLQIAIAEEQMVVSEAGSYPSPTTGDLGRNLVHELGHVVECGLDGSQRAQLDRAYSAARGRFPADVVGALPAYSTSNKREYFAEGAAAWFEAGSHASYRRAWLLEHDPQLHSLLASVFAVPPAVPECDGERATRVLTIGDQAFTGTPGPDVVVGSDGPDLIHGGAGADIVCSGGGDDILFGGSDGDRLFGGLGNDLLNGGVGDDALVDVEGVDRLVAGGGQDFLDARDEGVAGPDILDGSDATAQCEYDEDDDVRACLALTDQRG